MRQVVDRQRLERFMRELGSKAVAPARVYFTGGVTAILHGWRPTTIDIDLKFVPEHDELFRAVASLKEELQVNVELASPRDFIPESPGWESRSIFIGQEGHALFFHYDPYSQALAKLERRHVRDLEDVDSMAASGLIDPEKLLDMFRTIEPALYRYPAVNPRTFQKSVSEFVRSYRGTK